MKNSSKAVAHRTISPSDLLKFKLVGDPQVSPDGSRVCFVVKKIGKKNDPQTSLWMVDSDSRRPRQFTRGIKDSQPRWSPDGSQLAFVSSREHKPPQVHLMDVAGGEARTLTDLPEGVIAQLRWSPNGKQLAIIYRQTAAGFTREAERDRKKSGASTPPRQTDSLWYRLDGDGYFLDARFQLLLVDAVSGEHRVLYDRDTLGAISFDFSPDGRRIVVSTNRDKQAMVKPWKDELRIIDIKSGRSRAVPNMPAGPKSNVCWSPDGRWLAYAGRLGRDGSYSVENLELFVCDARRGNARSLTAKQDYCLLAVSIGDAGEAEFAPWLAFSPDSSRLLTRIGHHGAMQLASLPVAGGKITFHTTGEHDQSFGNVASNGRISMLRGSASTLAEVYLGVIEKGRLKTRQLSRLNRSQFSQLDIARPTSHWVTSADGHRFQAWVMQPPRARSGRKYPAVIQVHGGPHAQYGYGFFHEFQVLAAAGYMVIYSNPRGSKGYGRDHCAAIHGDWGGDDWVDIQALTEFTQQLAGVQPERVAIMGGSYGGYMTNWAIGHSQQYKAAITDRCVSNLVSMSGNSDFPLEPDVYFPGNGWDRPEERWRQSPIAYFGNVSTPTLVIHSEGDLRCNIEQGEQVFSALQLRGVPSRMVRYPSTTSHGMSRMGPADLRIDRLEEILDWFKNWL
jgi:dipeptidyl aminopeptidase/acylaminoacyl peptidase